MPHAGTFMSPVTVKRTALASLAATMALLGGCMLDPASIAIGAANAAAMASLTPEEVGATPADYRGYNCEMLKANIASFEQELYKDSGDTRIWQWHLNAMRQVQAEKNCSGVAGAAPTATAAVAPQPALDTPTRGVLGIRLDNLSAPVAEALGLTPVRGALAVEIVPGSGAQRAGIKPMDVVLEIAGQPVQSPVELQTIVSRMRAGYRAPLQVWRKRKLVEVNVEVMTAAALQAAQSAAAPTPATPAAVAAGGPQTLRYCHAVVQLVKKPGAVRSIVWEDTQSSGSEADRVASLNAFIAHVHAVQPGVWHDFDAPSCIPDSGICRANATRLVGDSHLAMEFCYTSAEEAVATWNRLGAATPTVQTLTWPQQGVVASPANLMPINR